MLSVRRAFACGVFGLASSIVHAEPPNLTVTTPTLAASTAIAPSVTLDPKSPDAFVAAAKTVAPPKPATTLVAKVDLSKQVLTVLVHGKVRHSWPISSGRYEFPTPVGTFQPEWSAKMWYSKKYDDAPMPHAVFFKNGAAIHATNATGMLGNPASHGCVRLSPSNAAQFYALVQSHGMVHTRIAVSGTPKFSPAAIARGNEGDRNYRRLARAETGYGQAYASYPFAPTYRTAAYAQPYYPRQNYNSSPFAQPAYRLR
jgi:lipoprotein-anchoring transpeptidase ErfK/SrfK